MTILVRLVLMAILALVAALSSCAPPSQHDPARYGTVRVSYGPGSDWTSQQRAQFDEQLQAMAALGPDFVRVDDSSADVVVRHWDSGDGCPAGAADYAPIMHVIRIDPVCTRGDSELRTALGHELGHHLGLTHVCRSSGELPNCSPVGAGVAVMNPRLAYGDSEISTDHAYDGELPAVWPHQLDLAEFRRVRER